MSYSRRLRRRLFVVENSVITRITGNNWSNQINPNEAATFAPSFDIDTLVYRLPRTSNLRTNKVFYFRLFETLYYVNNFKFWPYLVCLFFLLSFIFYLRSFLKVARVSV